MRLMQTAGLLTLTLALGGCFQSTTILHVKADRSGTILQRTVFTGAALAQLEQLAQFGGPNGKAPDLLSEDQARAMATNLGTGVAYVSSTPIKTESTEGRESLYAFPDINTLRISQQPPAPGGVTVRADSLGPRQEITFTLEPQPDGNQVLHIHMPELQKLPGVSSMPEGQPGTEGAPQGPTDQRIEMAEQLFAGMRLTVAVEPDGRLVKTNSPYVNGNRVTLLDFDFDRIVANRDLVRKLQEVKTPADAQALMKDLPGLKFAAEREITIEFAPTK